MNNAINQPQTVLVLGGNSDIARAIVLRLASPALRTVVLACRRPAEADTTGFGDGVEVSAVAFDAINHDNHRTFIQTLAREHGDLDVVIQAFALLHQYNLH